MDNADKHYRKIESQGVEPIKSMESVAILGLPQEFHAAVIRNLNLALAVKHITRCGEKDGQDAGTEISKAQNYLHRALTGQWRPSGRTLGGPVETTMVEPDPKEHHVPKMDGIVIDNVGRIFQRGVPVRSTILNLTGKVVEVFGTGCNVLWDDAFKFRPTTETFGNLELLPETEEGAK